MKKILLITFAAVLTLTMFATPAFASTDDDGSAAPTTVSTTAETTTVPRLTPSVVVSGFNVSKKNIMPGDAFYVTYTLKNTSRDFRLVNIYVKISGGDAFSTSGTDTKQIEAIPANGTVTLKKKLTCINGTAAGTHYINTAVTFEYIDNNEKNQGAADLNMSIKTVNAPTTTTTTKKSSKAALTPQLTVGSFSYGNKAVSGGDTFVLTYNLKNNSDVKDIKNVLVKLAGGDTFVVADGTDTTTVKTVKKNGSISLSKKFSVLQSATSGVYPISASISYEYYTGNEKQQGTAELTMSVPVVQPDKVSIESIGLSGQNINTGEESDCSFQIINSGQTKLSNGTITLKNEDGKSLATAFLGNIEAGTQFTSNYNLPVTFDKEGEQSLTLVFTYQNENMDKVSVEQPFSVSVQKYEDPYADMSESPDESTDNDSKSGLPVWAYFVIVGGGIAAIVICAVAVKKSKAKKKAKMDGVIADEEI